MILTLYYVNLKQLHYFKYLQSLRRETYSFKTLGHVFPFSFGFHLIFVFVFEILMVSWFQGSD